MATKIQEDRFPITATLPKAGAPETPEIAQAQGAVDCAPTTAIDRTIFDLQVQNSRGAVLNDVFKYPSNVELEAQKKAITARRLELAKTARPYEPSIKLDLGQEFSWNSAVAGVEMSDLAYLDEKAIREQAAKWGFPDVKFVEKTQKISGVRDFFHARDVQAFVAGNDEAIAVTFRGTERGSLQDILTDLAALFPRAMRVKAFPKGLTPEAEAAFNQRLLKAMGERVGPDFVNVVANQNSRMSDEQLRKVIEALPQATAEALGDASSAKEIESAIHRGFRQAKDKVAPELLTKVLSMWEDDLINQRALRPVFLFGHSMGGSEATLFGYDLLAMTEQLGGLAKAAGLENLSSLVKPGFKLPLGGVYTYEAPKSFKQRAADEVKSMDLGFKTEALIHNFVRAGDPVPKLPNWGSWTNLGNTILLNGTIGRLPNCPDPRTEALINPTREQINALKAKRKTDWLDTTAPPDRTAHLLNEVRDLVKAQARAAAPVAPAEPPAQK